MQASDVVITMGCGDACPYLPGQALRGLEARRPGRPGRRGRAPDPRRDRPPGAGARSPSSWSRPIPRRCEESTMTGPALDEPAPSTSSTWSAPWRTSPPTSPASSASRPSSGSCSTRSSSCCPPPRSRPSCPCWRRSSPRSASGRSAGSRGLCPPTPPACCSSASTTPVGPRWRRAGCATWPGTTVVVWSGGSEPASEINPTAVEAMAEVGIDITEEFPKPWTDEVVRAADVVITMGCGDACPLYPGTRYEDWELDDPAGHGPRGRPTHPRRDPAPGRGADGLARRRADEPLVRG